MSKEEQKRIIEIGGVKVEVDLRQAKTVDTYRIGDPVRLMVKSYGDQYECCHGVIISFAEFKSQPAIEVLYINNSSISPDLAIATISASSDKYEIATVSEVDTRFSREGVLEKIDRMITQKEEELAQLKTKKNLFVKYFGKVKGAGR